MDGYPKESWTQWGEMPVYGWSSDLFVNREVSILQTLFGLFQLLLLQVQIDGRASPTIDNLVHDVIRSPHIFFFFLKVSHQDGIGLSQNKIKVLVVTWLCKVYKRNKKCQFQINWQEIDFGTIIMIEEQKQKLKWIFNPCFYLLSNVYQDLTLRLAFHPNNFTSP